MDQKTMKILGGIIGGFVVFIIILFLISSCGKKSYTYEKLENKMLTVAKKYYEKHEDDLPKDDKGKIEYSLKDMIANGEIKRLDKILNKKDVKCDGKVTITNNNGYYNYSPYLNCEGEYETKYLSQKIIDDNLVTDDIGLYKVGNEYIMKGEVTNNYLSFNNMLFRIIRINDDGSIRVMANEPLQAITWDDRYNYEQRTTSGINEYILDNQISSRIKEKIDNYYLDSTVWKDSVKNYITTQSLCIGKRYENDSALDNSIECSVKLDNQLFGTLTVGEYLQASLDSKCSYTTDKNCRNYNWLANTGKTLWTLTADKEKTYRSYSIYNTVQQSNCNVRYYVSVVFNITDKAIYLKGTGTEEDPYTFK